MASHPQFDAVVLVRYRSSPIAFGAFQHKGVAGTRPLGRGLAPDLVNLEPTALRMTGDARRGPPFELVMARGAVRLQSIDHRWFATVFWLTDGKAEVGLHVPRGKARATQRSLEAYLSPAQG